MWKALALVAVAVGALLVMRGSKLPPEILPVVSQGARDGAARVGGRCTQEKCLTVYVAPWCPRCVTMQGTIDAMSQQLKAEGVGVQVVLGMDKPPALMRYAQSFAQPVLLDDEGKFRRKAEIKAVPTFVVTDRQGEIVKSVAGGTEDVGTMRRALGL